MSGKWGINDNVLMVSAAAVCCEFSVTVLPTWFHNCVFARTKKLKFVGRSPERLFAAKGSDSYEKLC